MSKTLGNLALICQKWSLKLLLLKSGGTRAVQKGAKKALPLIITNSKAKKKGAHFEHLNYHLLSILIVVYHDLFSVKESNNSLLSQLTFIDTPGLNATNEHSEPSIRVIPNCDAIFWFIKLTGSVSEADLKFIKENINDKALFVIFSFVDAVENKEKSIEIALQRFKDFEIEVKGYFQLGRKKDIQENFKTTITRSIKDIANNYDVYNPYAHIYSVMCDMEELLVKFQTALTKEINNLDKKTDHISDTYSSSRSQFVTAWNNCTNRINNTIDTFNERCSNAMFCGGASSAIANNLNSIVSSLRDMGEAYDKIDASKLIEYGQQVTAMGQFQTKNERASELLKEIQETKKIFD